MIWEGLGLEEAERASKGPEKAFYRALQAPAPAQAQAQAEGPLTRKLLKVKIQAGIQKQIDTF